LIRRPTIRIPVLIKKAIVVGVPMSPLSALSKSARANHKLTHKAGIGRLSCSTPRTNVTRRSSFSSPKNGKARFTLLHEFLNRKLFASIDCIGALESLALAFRFTRIRPPCFVMHNRFLTTRASQILVSVLLGFSKTMICTRVVSKAKGFWKQGFR
jgi:hypothetical protein